MENPARYYVIHKCFRSYLKIPLKGNHILKFNTLIIDISCSLKSEIWRVHLQKTLFWLFARFKAISNNGLLVRAITDISFYTDLIGTMIEIN